MSALLRRRSEMFDVLVAAVLTVSILAISARIPTEGDARALDPLAYGAIVVATGSLALRRRWPLAVLAVVTAALCVYSARQYAGGPVYLTLMVALYSLASTTERRRSLLAAAAVIAVLLLVPLVSRHWEDGWLPLVSVGWAAAAVFLGDAARNRRAYLSGLEERARRLEETREEEARRQVAEERVRIARDLHDVVAHSLASINVQSGVAAHVIEQRPEEARRALLAIKETSKEALDELRATLGMLREGDSAAPRRPAPSLARLDTLVESSERAGLPVIIDVIGEVRPLPPVVDMTAYRIVQESLTNVVRHAGAATARVSVSYGPAFVDLEIVDDGRGGPAPPNGGGHGIAGMNERAVSVGGRLEAGPHAGGGFRVSARLPTGPSGPVRAGDAGP
ncbi:MAG: sensor histidine kinase [Actinomycetota bacterium]|nr:sensor histidine kinase [Actinomycetota bacterium]